MEKTTIANSWRAASVDCDPMGVNRIGMEATGCLNVRESNEK